MQIKVDSGDSDDVHIILDGVTMTNTNANHQCHKRPRLSDLKDGTTNTLSDSSSNSDEDADAVIFSKGDLTINGSALLLTLMLRKITVLKPMTAFI